MFCDPCPLAQHPGWSLRNLLALAVARWGAPSLRVLCYRERRGRCSLQHSPVFDITLPHLPGTRHPTWYATEVGTCISPVFICSTQLYSCAVCYSTKCSTQHYSCGLASLSPIRHCAPCRVAVALVPLPRCDGVGGGQGWQGDSQMCQPGCHHGPPQVSVPSSLGHSSLCHCTRVREGRMVLVQEPVLDR